MPFTESEWKRRSLAKTRKDLGLEVYQEDQKDIVERGSLFFLGIVIGWTICGLVLLPLVLMK